MGIGSSRLVRADLQAWYELDLSPDHKKFLLRIREEVLPCLQLLQADSPAIESNGKRRGLPSFTAFNLGAWGYGEVIQPDQAPADGWFSWQFQPPLFYFEQVSKEQEVERLIRLGSLRTTLEVLFIALWLWRADNNIKTGAKIKQLIDVTSFSSDLGMSRAGFLADLSPSMLIWLQRQVGSEETVTIEPVTDAMIDVACQMWPPDERARRDGAYRHSFRTWVYRDGRLHLSAPGNACGLDPEIGGREPWPGEGYTLAPHNVDHGTQQLPLLAGLAKLNQLARADGF